MLFSELSRFDDVFFIHVITKDRMKGRVIDLNAATEEALVTVEGNKGDWKRAKDLTKGE